MNAFVLTTDQNYAPYCAAVITQLLKYSTDQEIYVILDKETSYFPELSKLEKVSKRIKLINAAIELSVFNSKSARFPNIAYARLLVSDLLPDNLKKIVYLDCDTYVVQNIDYIFSINLNRPIAAIQNPDSWKILESNNYSATFNSGVLLIDLEVWRQNKIPKALVNLCGQYPYLLDQEILNLYFRDNWLTLPMTLNFLVTKKELARFGRTEIRPEIFHFVGVKPWSSNLTSVHREWRQSYPYLCEKKIKFNERLYPQSLNFSGSFGMDVVKQLIPQFLRKSIRAISSPKVLLIYSRDMIEKLRKNRRMNNLSKHIRNFEVNSILEIGVWKGQTAELMISSALTKKLTIKYVGVDLFMNLASQDNLEKEASLFPLPKDTVLNSLMEKFPSAQIELIEGYSQDILPTISDQSFDLILIDGGHSFETVSRDFEFSLKLLSPHGYIFLDDYTNKRATLKERFGVRQLVDDMNRDYLEVKFLRPVDSYPKEWGKLKTQLVRVRKYKHS